MKLMQTLFKSGTLVQMLKRGIGGAQQFKFYLSRQIIALND
jgi:hypothetical protein